MTEAQRAEKQKQFRRNLALGNYSLLSNTVLPTEEKLDVPPLLSQGTLLTLYLLFRSLSS